jgi:hypothetical protein
MEPTMSSTPPFGTQIIGQTEKALNAILDRLLDGGGSRDGRVLARANDELARHEGSNATR